MLDINDVIKVKKKVQDNIEVGEVGTIVHIFDMTPPVYLIEFIDDEGRTTKMVSLKEEDISLYWIASTETYVDN
ncbi:DUF4926 domain-containing protein [Psychrobacter sp. W2-37-MNA-CIBAN-0211]|uniref:DUF4926 domain-containing protein n=1 Tax=Psychrobacter sp. W2-37-MNA-CIBAN-0211 TaxID=3140443 RepID=UPI00331EC7E0